MSEFDPLEASRTFFPPSRPDGLGDELFDGESPPTDTPPLREGLPTGFRMRHDAHYVDQIVSRSADLPVRLVAIRDIDRRSARALEPRQELVASIRQFGILQPLLVRRENGRYQLIAGAQRLVAATAAGLTEVPCLLHQADDDRARALAVAARIRGTDVVQAVATPRTDINGITNELLQGLGAIASCLHLIPDPGHSLRGHLGLELARAELQRAIWVVQACRVLAGDLLVARKSLRVASIVDRVVSGFGPEQRLSRVQVDLEVVDPGFTIAADEDLVAIGVACQVQGILALLQKTDGTRIEARLLSRAMPAPAMVFEVSQDAVSVPASAADRFFDPAWTDRPGGRTAALGMAAARRVAELHRGRLDLTTSDRGCRLTMVIPGVA